MKYKNIFLINLVLICSCSNNNSSIHENIYFDYVEFNSKIYINGLLDNYKNKEIDLIIPSTINSLPIVSIKACAFENTKIKSLSFENDSNLSIIDEGAFGYCTSLEKIILPSSLQVINAFAFENCVNLKEIDFSLCNEIEKISTATFINNTSLESLVLPNCINVIETEAFANCDNFKEIIISSSIDIIEYYAFNNDIKLNIKFKDITSLPNNFSSDWNYSDKLCENNTNYISYEFV